MSVTNIAHYQDTDPVGIQPIRPTRVLTKGAGKHARWQELPVLVKDKAVPMTRAGARAWWNLAKDARPGVAFVSQRVWPIVMDAEGKAAINAHTRTIKNRRRAARDREEGSDDQLAAINAEKRARQDRKRARIVHNVRVLGSNGALLALGAAGKHAYPDFPVALDVLTATATTCGGVTAFGLVGRRVKGGESLLRKPKARTINDQLLREVMANLGISHLTQKVNEVKPVTLTVDNKTHFATTVRLPMNVSANQVQLKHEMFAANLDVDPDCLILDKGESASRLIVKVSKIPPAKRKQGTWDVPKTADIFGPLTIGENAIGDAVTVTVPASLLAYGETGWGKSVFLRLFTATAVLDPLVKLRLGAFKGSGDLAAFAPVAEQSIIGHASRDEVAHQGLLMLQGLNRECATRGDILANLGESEVTRALAEEHRELRPIVCVLDEIQLLFASKAGKEAKIEMLKLLSNLRSNGIRLVSATQHFNGVIDTKFPGAFTNVVVFKTALGEWEGRTLLGEGSDSQGLKPFEFKRPGEAIVTTEGERRRLRVFPVQERQQSDSVSRALSMRGGSVPQIPLTDEQPQTAPKRKTGSKYPNLLQDILDMETADDQGSLQSRQIVERLPQRDEYTAFTFTDEASRNMAAVELSCELRKILGSERVRDVNKKKQGRATSAGIYISEIHEFKENQ